MDRACARSTARRRHRSRSTPTKTCSTASAARPGATSSTFVMRGRARSTSPRRSSGWPPGRASPCATPTATRAEGRKTPRPARRDHGAGPSPGTTSACCRAPTPAPPGATCGSAGSTATWCASSSSAGRPTPGTRCARALRLDEQDLRRRHRARPASTAGDACRTTSGPGSCSRSTTTEGDPISFGGRILPGGGGPGQPGQVQEHHRDAALQQVQGALRARPGQDRDRHGTDRRHLRGLHRRDRVPPSRRAPGGGHLRHRAHRRSRDAAHPLRRAPPGAGVRRRRRRPGRRRAVLPVGARARPRGGGRRPAAGPGPCRRGRSPTPTGSRPRWTRRRRSCASASTGRSPPPTWPATRDGPGRPSERWRDRRRAPDRPRARPVRDGRRLALPGRARPAARPAREVRLRSRPRPAAAACWCAGRGLATGARARADPRRAPRLGRRDDRPASAWFRHRADGRAGRPAGARPGRERRAPAPRREGPAARGAAPRRPRSRGGVGAGSTRELFDDPVQPAPTRPCSTPTPTPTRGRPPRPEVADLLARLLVDGADVRAVRRRARLLHMEVARRQIAAVRLAGATTPTVTQALADLAVADPRHRRPAQRPNGGRLGRPVASLAGRTGWRRGMTDVPSTLDTWNGSADDELAKLVEQAAQPRPADASTISCGRCPTSS